LARAISDFRPDIIVSTYPLYAYLFRVIQRRRLGLRTPFVTVITDSVGVNSAWHRCLSDAFIVADEETADLLRGRGVPGNIVHALGFPVARYFETAAGGTHPDGPPWRLLFMPSTQVKLTLRQIQTLREIPGLALTVVTGRHERLFEAVKSSGFVEQGACDLIGWTDAMPRLLCEHHAFIGKAGGAIVQEAIAAQCPFFVSHLVPGQEEGNIALLERLEVGVPAFGDPDRLAGAVREAFADNAAVWRGWKERLARVSRPDAAAGIARFLLNFPAA
jgi:processive 1,2-diacylglycerol beta-glucosyltransferase